MKMKLTKTALDSIKAPAKGRLTVHDTIEPGLCVRITENDSRTFYVCRWKDGKVVWVRLGTVAEMTIEQARDDTREGRSDIRAGDNPNAKKKAAREALTLSDLWTVYREDVKKAERTRQEDEGLWRRYLEPAFGNRRLQDITGDAAQKLYNRIRDGGLNRESIDKHGNTRRIRGGPTAAHHAIKLLGEMFSASAKKLPNPVADVTRAKETSSTRYITVEEFPAFWAALEEQDEVIRDILKLALFTAQRRTPLLSMRWDEVKLPFKTWTTPEEKMKSRRKHTCYLCPQAMEILTRRKAAADGDWVFGNPESATGFLRNPEKAVERIWKAAGIAPFSLHDLRRTASTWLNDTGATHSDVMTILDHVMKGATAVYAKSTPDRQREVMTTAVDAMLIAAGAAYAPPRAEHAAA